MRSMVLARGVGVVAGSAALILAALPASADQTQRSQGIEPANGIIAPAYGCAVAAANRTDVATESQLRTAILNSVDDSHICLTANITLTQVLPSIDDTGVNIDGNGQFGIDLAGNGHIYASFTTATSKNLRFLGLTVAGATTSGAITVDGDDSVSVTLDEVTLDGNVTNTMDGGGAAFTDVRRIFIYDTTVSDNQSTTGGKGAGIAISGGELVNVFGSTFSGNTATGDGGGLFISGNGGAVIQNSTFSGNTSTGVGGGLVLSGGSHTVRYVTVVGNSATSGGGMSISNSATYDIDNAIINQNTATATGADVDASSAGAGTIDDASVTSVADITGSPTTAGVITGDPGLCPLADNGGPTLTHAPESGSPVLDQGTGIVNLTVDQRGQARPTSGSVDLGAVEGTGSCGSITAPPTNPPAVFPPSAPLNVTARLKVGQIARIVWDPPASSGSFPITTYQVTASTGTGTCLAIAPARTCDISGVLPGVTYTYRVRALNGAGWGPLSEPSNPVSWGSLYAPPGEENKPGGIGDIDRPVDPSDPSNPTDPANPDDPGLGPTPTIMIIGAREDPRRVTATGYTSDIPVGVRVVPWRKVTGMADFERGTGIRQLRPDESFEWQRRIQAWRSITFYFTAVDGVSNTVTITPDGSVTGNAPRR